MARPKNQIPTKLFARRLNASQIQTVTEALEKWGSGSITAHEMQENEKRYLLPEKRPLDDRTMASVGVSDQTMIDDRRKEVEWLKTQQQALLNDLQEMTERGENLSAELDKVRRDVSGNEKAAYWASEATRFKRRVIELESLQG